MVLRRAGSSGFRFRQHLIFSPGDLYLKKILLNIFLLSLVFLLIPSAIWFIGAPFMSARIEDYAMKSLPWDFQYKSCRIEPGWPPSIQFEDTVFRSALSRELLFKCPRLSASPSWSALWTGSWRWRKISLEKPDLYFQKNSTESWNWQPAETQAAPHIEKLEILNAAIHVREAADRGLFDLFFRSAHALVEFRLDQGIVNFDVFGFVRHGEEKSFTLSGTYSRGRDAASGTLSLDDESWMFEGTLTEPFSAPAFEGKVDAAGIDFGALLKAWGFDKPLLDGEATFEGEGRIQGVIPKDAAESLILRGGIDLRKGRFLTLNPVLQALREALQLTGGALELKRLEETDYAYLFVEGTLPFEFLQASPDVTQGELYLKEVLVKHADYLIEAEGSYSLRNEEMDFRGKLVLLEPVSAFLMKLYPGLQAFLNPQKRLVFPVIYRGLLFRPVFKFDENYLKSKMSEISAGTERANQPSAPAPV